LADYLDMTTAISPAYSSILPSYNSGQTSQSATNTSSPTDLMQLYYQTQSSMVQDVLSMGGGSSSDWGSLAYSPDIYNATWVNDVAASNQQAQNSGGNVLQLYSSTDQAIMSGANAQAASANMLLQSGLLGQSTSTAGSDLESIMLGNAYASSGAYGSSNISNLLGIA
jgi:hypothetical protein